MQLYRWSVKPELVRFVAVVILSYLVQIAPTLVDDVSTASNPWKVGISVVVAGLQFAGARLLAYMGDKAEPPPSPPSMATSWTYSGYPVPGRPGDSGPPGVTPRPGKPPTPPTR